MDIDEAPTTHLNDFRIPSMEPYEKHRWLADKEEIPELPPPKPQEYTCSETLTKLRNDKYVPMNLMWRARPVIDALPDVCGVPEKIFDKNKAEIIKTRPRIYGSNAASIDDVEDPEIRKLLVSYVYTTDFKRSMKETQDYVSKHRQGLELKSQQCKCVPKVATPCKVKDEGVVHPYVPVLTPSINRNQRKGFDAWDQKQMRATVDLTTKYWSKFYQNRTPDKPLTSFIPDETIDRLTDLIETNQLRGAHDKAVCGYTGHLPKITMVNVKKIELPMEHPMHTTYDTIFVNHYDHAKNNYEK